MNLDIHICCIFSMYPSRLLSNFIHSVCWLQVGLANGMLFQEIRCWGEEEVQVFSPSALSLSLSLSGRSVWQVLCSPPPSPGSQILLGSLFYSFSFCQIPAATASPYPFRTGDGFLLFLASVSSLPSLNPHLCKSPFL